MLVVRSIAKRRTSHVDRLRWPFHRDYEYGEDVHLGEIGVEPGALLPLLKQQLCIQNGTRAYYLSYLQRGRVMRGKEAQAIGLASQSDGQKSDRQTGDRQREEERDSRQTGRDKADERWYLSRPCSVLTSGLRTLRR